MSTTNKSRAWIFPGLVIAATGLLIYSWFMPLWGLDIAMLGPDRVIVRSWGEELFIGAYADMFPIPRMPAFFPVLMWLYLAVCVVLLLSSLVLPERPFHLGVFRLSLPQAVIGGVGLMHMVFAAVAAIVISFNLGQFEVDGVTTPLQGTVTLNFGNPYVSEATSSLRLGYWLAWAAAIFLVALAVLRPWIAGNGKRQAAEEMGGNASQA